MERNYILGISCYYHDSAAVLTCDGEIISAVQEERFSRKKHDSKFPENAVKYCLKSNNLENKLLIISGPVTNNVSAFKQSFEKFSLDNSDYLNIYNSSNHVNVFAKIINRINND